MRCVQLLQAPDEPEEDAIELDLAPLDPDDEIEVAMKEASEADLVDLAGLLGFHSMLSQPQYYNAIKGKLQDESTGRTFKGCAHVTCDRINCPFRRCARGADEGDDRRDAQRHRCG